MASEPVDAPNTEADSAFLEFDSAKSEAVDTRGTPPVDARTTMWRCVLLYAWLATLLVAVWGFALATKWVYEQRPPLPSEAPFSRVRGELRRGMSSEEVWIIMSKYLPPYKGDGGHCTLNGDCERTNDGIRGEPMMYYEYEGDTHNTETIAWTWRSKEDRFGLWVERLEIEYYKHQLERWRYSCQREEQYAVRWGYPVGH